MVIIIAQIVRVLGIIIASIMFFYARKRMEEANGTMHKIQEKWKTVKRETENERREAQLKVKDEIYRKRMEFGFLSFKGQTPSYYLVYTCTFVPDITPCTFALIASHTATSSLRKRSAWSLP